MILGVCTGTDENSVKMAKEIGYRYIETGIRGFYENRAGLDATLSTLDKYKIRCEVGQHPFPGEYDPSGKQSKEALEKIRDYMYELISATSDLNIEKLVMGAGGARTLPSPDKYDNVVEQMADICKYSISPVLDHFGIILTLEGLVKGETNMMNTTDESVNIVKLANEPNIKVMVDLYHAANENEKFEDFVNYKGYIMHSHIGKPVPRVMPSRDDGYDYKPFFDALRSAGFNGRMSVEAGSSRADYRESLEEAFITLSPLL